METEIPFLPNPFNISTQQAPFSLIYLEEADTNVCSWPILLLMQCPLCYLGKVSRLRTTTDWERLEIFSKKLEITREYFMQRWAQQRRKMVWT